MEKPPDDDALFAAALELTDTLGVAPPSAADPLAAATRATLGLLGSIALASGARPDAVAADPVLASLFDWGPLRVTAPLGAGSDGEVFAAWDPTLHREVALKLRRAHAGALRWLDEARALARVRHRNVLTVYGADLFEDRAGIWTERITGNTLEQELDRRGPMRPTEAARIVRDLADALRAVHGVGLVHGDITASNVMIEAAATPVPGAPGRTARRVVLMDFGTSTAIVNDGRPHGIARGTPLAIAPEVLDGAAPTERSDVYSLGVLLHRLLTGEHPVQATTLEALRDMHARAPVSEGRGPRRFGARGRLDRLARRALARDPSRRPASAAVVRDALDAVVHPERVLARRVRWAGAISVALGVAVVLLARRTPRDREAPVFRDLPRATAPQLVRRAWALKGTAGANIGWDIAGVGDVNGDGYADVVIGNPEYGGGLVERGRLLVFLGAAHGLALAPDQVIPGRNAGGLLGSNVAMAGDVNGDGFADVLVSEQGYAVRGDRRGAIHLFLGGPHGLPDSASWTHVGDLHDSPFGENLTGVGDVNGDHFDDFVASMPACPAPGGSQARLELFLGGRDGPAQDPTWSAEPGQFGANFGYVFGPGGDLDADGYADIVVPCWEWTGRFTQSGRVCIYRGGPHGPSRTPDWSGEGDQARSGFGWAVAYGRDVDGDGVGDLLVGEPGCSLHGFAVGRALLFRGRRGRMPDGRPNWTYDGVGTQSRFGESLAILGDFDGDGRNEVAISAPRYSPSPNEHEWGAVYLFRGASRGLDDRPAAMIRGDRDGLALGGNVQAAGDVNHDGRADLLIASLSYRDSTEAIRGRVELWSGRAGRSH